VDDGASIAKTNNSITGE